MGMIADMKRLDRDDKLPSRTTPEIIERVTTLVGRYKKEGERFQDHKISVEAFVSAVLIEFLEMPKEEQDRIVKRGIRRFERNIQGIPLDETRAESIQAETGRLSTKKLDPKPKRRGKAKG